MPTLLTRFHHERSIAWYPTIQPCPILLGSRTRQSADKFCPSPDCNRFFRSTAIRESNPKSVNEISVGGNSPRRKPKTWAACSCTNSEIGLPAVLRLLLNQLFQRCCQRAWNQFVFFSRIDPWPRSASIGRNLCASKIGLNTFQLMWAIVTCARGERNQILKHIEGDSSKASAAILLQPAVAARRLEPAEDIPGSPVHR